MAAKTSKTTSLPEPAEILRQTRESGDSTLLRSILKRSEGGDEAALRTAREILKLSPHLQELYDPLHNLVASILTGFGEGNRLFRENTERQYEAMCQEVAGPNPTPLERLLATRVALCWLQMMYEDTKDAQMRSSRCTWEASAHAQRRAERAQQRFLAAVKTLATVRKLALPSVQVNVAQNQVNVATPELTVVER